MWQPEAPRGLAWRRPDARSAFDIEVPDADNAFGMAAVQSDRQALF